MRISKEKLFLASKTPIVKWRSIITEATAEATPRPLVPYAKRHIGTPMFPVLGKIKGGNSLITSFLSINKKNKPTKEKPPIIIKE